MNSWILKQLILNIPKGLFYWLGITWLLIEVTNFFFPQFAISRYGVWFFIISFGLAIITNFPKSRYEYKLKNRDIKIALVIGDAFDHPQHPLVVPVNNYFDMLLNGNLMRTGGVNRQVIDFYYGHDPKAMQNDVDLVLKNNRNYFNSQKQNRSEYKLGTVVHLEHKDRNFYLVVNSIRKNNYHVHTNYEKLTQTMPEMWRYFATEADKLDTLTVPLLGTGQGGIDRTREEVFRLIVDSFIASLNAKVFVSKLEIVIKPADVNKYDIDVQSLIEYLKYKTKYAS